MRKKINANAIHVVLMPKFILFFWYPIINNNNGKEFVVKLIRFFVTFNMINFEFVQISSPISCSGLRITFVVEISTVHLNALFINQRGRYRLLSLILKGKKNASHFCKETSWRENISIYKTNPILIRHNF